MYVSMHVCSHVEVRGHRCEVGFLHPPLCRFQGLPQVAMLTGKSLHQEFFPSHLTGYYTNFTVATITLGNSALIKTFTFS